MNKPIIVPEE